jgi:hypothetical protein
VSEGDQGFIHGHHGLYPGAQLPGLLRREGATPGEEDREEDQAAPFPGPWKGWRRPLAAVARQEEVFRPPQKGGIEWGQGAIPPSRWA